MLFTSEYIIIYDVDSAIGVASDRLPLVSDVGMLKCCAMNGISLMRRNEMLLTLS